jgi:predicted GH43/DUF377 family glycosyl hydrolase
MKWRKLGLVFSPPKDVAKAVSHAQVPTPLLVNDEILRIYYSARDQDNVSRPYYVDVAADDPLRILDYARQPLFEPGPVGCFDDNGILPCSVCRVTDSLYYMFYVGFELCQKIRYKLFTGLAVSQDGISFSRQANVPVFPPVHNEFCFRCGPFVRLIETGFEAYYVGGSDWMNIGGKQMPRYEIKHMVSPDGLHWPDEGRTIIPITDSDEHGFGRPWLFEKDDGGYELCYSVRRVSFAAYRLGWATSTDGLNWTRRDAEFGLDVTPGSFDGQAVMYAALVKVRGRTFCFYNGDDFGAEGFAAAILED